MRREHLLLFNPTLRTDSREVADIRLLPDVECTQIHAFIPQLLEIYRAPSLDERHHATNVFRAVQTDNRVDSSIVQIAGQKAAGVKTATHHELFPLRLESCVLQIGFVLVGPEPVDLLVGDRSAKHVASGNFALFERIVPVLDSHLPIEDRMIVIRDVTSGKNAADVGPAVLVNDDTVVHQEDVVTLEHLHGWLDADADDHEVTFQSQPTLGDNGGYPPSSFEPDDAVLEDGANTVSAMEVSNGLADGLPEHPRERRRRRVDGDHLQNLSVGATPRLPSR